MVRKYTQHNGYGAHEEQVLVNLISSMDKSDRELGVSVIMRIRRGEVPDTTTGKKKKKEDEVRVYKPRKINFQATTVQDLIDLSLAETQPPLLLSKTDEEIRSFINHPYEPPKYECISQFVERAVKLTSESVPYVSGVNRQDGVTINTQKSRQLIKSNRKKSHV